MVEWEVHGFWEGDYLGVLSWYRYLYGLAALCDCIESEWAANSLVNFSPLCPFQDCRKMIGVVIDEVNCYISLPY